MEEPNRNTEGDGDGDASEARGISEEAVDPSATEDIVDDEMDSMSSTSSDSPRSNKINWDEIFNRKNKAKKKQKKAPKQMIQKKRCGARKRPREQKASTVIYPMSDVERVYEAEFKVKAHRMMALPKRYDVAAQITLENGSSNCHAEPRQDLINVTLEEIPNVQLQDLMDKYSNIIRPYVVPEPCQKHPYQIILPYENGLSMLPVTDVHRELASFAAFNGTHIVASENALKCLCQWNRHWLIPFSICATVKPDGTIKNVLVLDSEFSVHRETAPMRTYKAFRHMLEQALITLTERERVAEIHRQVKAQSVGSSLFVNTGDDVEMAAGIENLQISPDMLYVFGSPKTEFGTPEAVLVRPNSSFVPQNTRFVSPISGFGASSTTSGEPQGEESMSGETEGNLSPTADLSEQDGASGLAEAANKKISGEGLAVPGLRLYSCSCTDSVRRKPPLRSFRRWQFRREGNSERHDFIVHCSHKCKDETGELILEPIPEYQSEKGKSEQSHDSVRSTALSLTLRKNAYLVNVRINGRTGEVANYEKLSSKTFVKKYPDVKRQVINSILAVFSQLEQLKPGPYLLQHEPSHGPNAMIMCPQVMRKKHTLLLNFDRELKEMSKVQVVKIPPTPAFLQASTSRD